MKRLSAIFSLLLMLVAAGLAQGKAVTGTFTLSYGFVRDIDGRMRSVKGLVVPFKAEPIRLGAGGSRTEVQPRLTTVYQNDQGPGSYYTTGSPQDPESFICPSACDDVTMTSAGQGGVWRQLTVGYLSDTRDEVLLRWIAFDSYVSGRGAGVSAFDGVLADFGGYFTFDAARFPDLSLAYKITFDISVAGANVPDGAFYFASQIREPDPIYWQGIPIGDTGEGAFRQDVWTVFSTLGPTIGTSQDIFWFDWDPLDGIYDELEADNFGTIPGANLLLKIEIGGSQSELFPVTVNQIQGRYKSGDFTSLWFSDDEHYVSDNFSNSAESVWPISVVIESVSPTTNILSARIVCESRMQFSGFRQRISLWNFTQAKWVIVSEDDIENFDKIVDYTIGGNPQQFVNSSNRRMRARVEIQERLFNHPRTWDFNIDRFTWFIARP